MTRNEKIAQKFNAEDLLQIVQLRRKKQISSKEVYGCAFMYYRYLHVNGCLLRVAERKRNKLSQHLTIIVIVKSELGQGWSMKIMRQYSLEFIGQAVNRKLSPA